MRTNGCLQGVCLANKTGHCLMLLASPFHHVKTTISLFTFSPRPMYLALQTHNQQRYHCVYPNSIQLKLMPLAIATLVGRMWRYNQHDITDERRFTTNDLQCSRICYGMPVSIGYQHVDSNDNYAQTVAFPEVLPVLKHPVGDQTCSQQRYSRERTQSVHGQITSNTKYA